MNEMLRTLLSKHGYASVSEGRVSGFLFRWFLIAVLEDVPRWSANPFIRRGGVRQLWHDQFGGEIVGCWIWSYENRKTNEKAGLLFEEKLSW